jgi:hypothetical protein
MCSIKIVVQGETGAGKSRELRLKRLDDAGVYIKVAWKNKRSPGSATWKRAPLPADSGMD